ncbi:hypothetical protein KSP35_04645 [Aquihabitans sp. G128]|uniref:hypothetical protein n=1 Tax=Aquihabitans sp. G128 TaxID=2849779 RepID=UPI001C24A77A|nr:hypothetical protein [Aquihabitans sp. G128]QXC62103.1 hypothetical protein KSP35_04645 [Aquihabitans sp. G128]
MTEVADAPGDPLFVEADERVAPVAPTARRRAPARDTWITVGCWALVTVPLVVALVAAYRPHWYPVADLAQYELRVRDVGGRHTPLIGLAGRIGPWYDPGSHPGPLSFWMLAPVYRLLGSTSWAFTAAAVSLHALAMGLVLWMGKRRGGLPLVLALTAALAVLTRFYGHHVFIEPWNPYLPVLWWLVLLLAVWSVLEGDVVMVVPAVVAGTFCAQTHLPYVGLVGGLGVFLAVPLAISLWKGRTAEDQAAAARARRWSAGAVVLAVLLWTPPVIDEIWGVGNLTRIKDSVSNPTEGVSGIRGGFAELLRNLDPTAYLTGRDLTGVSTGSGVCWAALLLLVAWAASAVAVWRLGHRTLVRLHLVLAAALALAAISSTRIYGLLWSYLFLWAWGLTALLVVATAWSLLVVARHRWPAAGDVATSPRLAAVAVLVAVVAAASFSVGNLDAVPARTDLSQDLGAVSRQAVPKLASGDLVGSGRSGRYLVRWTDRVTIGSQGFGLVNELERQGFTVGVDKPFGVGATQHRVLPLADATGVLQLVTGPDIPAWDANPLARRIAYRDARTPAERAGYDRMVAQVQQELTDAGLTKQAGEWSGNLFTTSLDPDVPEPIKVQMREVLAIRAPVAIYLLAPTDATP